MVKFEDLSKYRGELMGLAILFVILFHIGMPQSNFFYPLRRLGNIGVDMFLFVSGMGLWFSWTRSRLGKKLDGNGAMGLRQATIRFFKHRYKPTVEGLSEKFNPEYWNYAKLISGVLRYRMPIANVIKLVGQLQMDSQSINTWKIGVERALKKYIVDGTEAKGQKCPVCGQETLVYQEGCLICKNCGSSRCG